jgi:hypothetical protein
MLLLAVQKLLLKVPAGVIFDMCWVRAAFSHHISRRLADQKHLRFFYHASQAIAPFQDFFNVVGGLLYVSQGCGYCHHLT